jgi:hypothetical protein
MEEITFKFTDDSYYIVRMDNNGDSVCGEAAHDLMRKINKEFGYGKIAWRLKVDFILKTIS